MLGPARFLGLTLYEFSMVVKRFTIRLHTQTLNRLTIRLQTQTLNPKLQTIILNAIYYRGLNSYLYFLGSFILFLFNWPPNPSLIIKAPYIKPPYIIPLIVILRDPFKGTLKGNPSKKKKLLRPP